MNYYIIKLKNFYNYLNFYYPLSKIGSFTFLLSLYTLGYAYTTSNLYALLISIPLLICLILIVFYTRFWYLKQSEVEVVWESGKNLFSRSENSYLIIKINASSPPYFFRYHIVLFAKLIVGRASNLYYFIEASTSDAGEARLNFYFPLCGNLNIRSYLVLKDILGITRTRLGKYQDRNFIVRPPLLNEKPFIPKFNANTFENQKHQRQSDEEKYFMREYIAGDRIKDINWKSSLRIGELITRISPQAPEKSPLVYIEFRNTTFANKDSIKSLMQLNILKSWLYTFIIHLHRMDSRYKFFIQTAVADFNLNTSSDIENFGVTLGEINYVIKNSWFNSNSNVLEKFIFTTMYDPTLKLQNQSRINFNIFQVTTPTHLKKSRKGKINFSNIRFLQIEKSSNGLPILGPWIFNKIANSKLPKQIVLGKYAEQKLVLKSSFI